MNMKLRYRLFLHRKSVYYAFDDTTKTFTSLKTKDKSEANRLLMAMNEAGKQPPMNLSLARVYLRHSDPMVTTRTWQNVLEEIIGIKTGPTQARWKSAAKDKAFDLIRDRVLIETQGEHLLAVLRAGTVSTNAFLRKVHNFAVDMNWLPATVIPRRQWPAIVGFKNKQGAAGFCQALHQSQVSNRSGFELFADAVAEPIRDCRGRRQVGLARCFADS